jgi:hypothetical protein
MFGSREKREAKAQSYESQAKKHYSRAQKEISHGNEGQALQELSMSASFSEAARLTRLTGKPKARGWVF